MKNSTQLHARITLRNLLIEAIIRDGIHAFGGPNNATVRHPLFRINAGLKANRLLYCK